MPLDTSSYVYFFQGACAESHIAALFQFAGFEVTKITPDSGIDLVATNIARSRFANETPKSINVQVKSTIMKDEFANFWIAEDELDFLSQGENRYTIFAYFYDLEKTLDLDDFRAYTNQMDESVDTESPELQSIDRKDGGASKKHKNHILEFTKYSLDLFWLNSKQIQRSRDEGLWEYSVEFQKWGLNVSTQDGFLSIYNKKNDSFACPVSALQEVRYMMISSQSQASFDEGKFSFLHV
jgi:hypothetical protein